MEQQRRALGKGISSLIPTDRAESTQNKTDRVYREVPLGHIRPSRRQPRKFFDEEAIKELAQSIEKNGLIHPLLVRTVASGYELISGERRLRAATQLGLSHVPVFVRDVADQEQLELALVENIQRSDLDPIEESRGYSELMEQFNLKQEEVAERVGRSRSAVANSLRLLRLPEKLQEALQSGALSVGHAKALINEPIDRQLYLCDLVLENELSVRQLEAKLKQHRGPAQKKRPAQSVKEIPPTYRRLAEELKLRLGTQVQVLPGKKGHGKIVIEYYSDEQLDGLFEQLTGLVLTKKKSRGFADV